MNSRKQTDAALRTNRRFLFWFLFGNSFALILKWGEKEGKKQHIRVSEEWSSSPTRRRRGHLKDAVLELSWQLLHSLAVISCHLGKDLPGETILKRPKMASRDRGAGSASPGISFEEWRGRSNSSSSPLFFLCTVADFNDKNISQVSNNDGNSKWQPRTSNFSDS